MLRCLARKLVVYVKEDDTKPCIKIDKKPEKSAATSPKLDRPAAVASSDDNERQDRSVIMTVIDLLLGLDWVEQDQQREEKLKEECLLLLKDIPHDDVSDSIKDVITRVLNQMGVPRHREICGSNVMILKMLKNLTS